MGQKVHPIGFRLGYIKWWNARWYAKKNYSKLLLEDIDIRGYVKEKFYHAGISKVEIERTPSRVLVIIHAARPGIIIGRKGAEIEKLREDLKKMTQRDMFIDIREVKRPELDAQLVAENVALQIERRIAFRRVMKRSVDLALRAGAKGIKIACSGRLGGAEIARTEWYREGRVPLHTLRANIDYGFAEAMTTYGVIGVKVWIFKEEIFLKEVPTIEALEI